jgi:hypothetical protein
VQTFQNFVIQAPKIWSSVVIALVNVGHYFKAATTVLAAKVANPTAEKPTETLILSQPMPLFQNPIFFGPLHAP